MRRIKDKIIEQYDRLCVELVVKPEKWQESLEKFRWWLCELLENVEINKLQIVA